MLAKNIMVDQSRVFSVERQAISKFRWSQRSSRIWRWRNVGECRKLRSTDLRLVQTLLNERHALRGRCVRYNFANPQMIILKDLVAAALLSLVMLGDSAPSHNGFFVAPGGMR